MSGGHFDYNQYRLNDIVDEIEKLVQSNDSVEKDEWGQEKGSHYPADIIEKFKETIWTLKYCEAMVQRIDWLVSGDDGIDSFRKRWDEEMDKLDIEIAEQAEKESDFVSWEEVEKELEDKE